MTQAQTEIKKTLEYPFDGALITRKAKRFRRELLEQEGLLEKRIAVLGGSTTQQMVDLLELFLLSEGIKPLFYQSDYARFFEDAMFGNPQFDAFEPDIIIIHTTVRNLNALALRKDDFNSDSLLQEDKLRFTQTWDNLASKFSCPIIQNNFERPPYRLLGNQDICDERGISYYVQQMNLHVYSYAKQHPSFLVHDIDYLAGQFGLSRWHDSDAWCAYKVAFSIDAMPEFSHSLSRIICSLFGKRKKVLVTDLDNTLWSGIVGDDGPEGISMGPDSPAGEKHHELQSFLFNLRTTGIVLSVDSKNDESTAIEGLEQADCLLPPHMFASIMANWQPKSLNIDTIASTLSLGTDSFVFLDDNPAEREIIAQHHPEVSLVQFKDIGEAATLIDRAGFFEITTLTDDDLKRADQYRQNAQRKQAENSYSDYNAYLDSLNMKAQNVGFAEMYIPRIAQLTNKTNQFNLTTRRFTEDDIRAFGQNADNICIAMSLKDKFGDNGLVSVVVGKANGTALEIELWLMSCRVLKRGLEDLTFNLLLTKAKEHGFESIRGTYIPTKRNSIVKSLLEDFGFAKQHEAEDGTTAWFLDIEQAVPKETHIELID